MRAALLDLPGVAAVAIRVRERSVDVRFAIGNAIEPEAIARAVRERGFNVAGMRLEATGEFRWRDRKRVFALAGTPLRFPVSLPARLADVPDGAPVTIRGTILPPFTSRVRLRIDDVRAVPD